MSLRKDMAPNRFEETQRCGEQITAVIQRLVDHLEKHTDQLTGRQVSIDSFTKGERRLGLLIDLAITSFNIDYYATYTILRDLRDILEEMNKQNIEIEGIDSYQVVFFKERITDWTFGIAAASRALRQTE